MISLSLISMTRSRDGSSIVTKVSRDGPMRHRRSAGRGVPASRSSSSVTTHPSRDDRAATWPTREFRDRGRLTYRKCSRNPARARPPDVQAERGTSPRLWISARRIDTSGSISNRLSISSGPIPAGPSKWIKNERTCGWGDMPSRDQPRRPPEQSTRRLRAPAADRVPRRSLPRLGRLQIRR